MWRFGSGGSSARFATGLMAGLCLLGPVERHAAADSADLNPARDTTIQSDFLDRSNGSGPNVFSGRTGSHGLRRALLAFDTVSGVPQDSIVTSAVFRLYMNKTVFGASDFALHKLLSDWGEAGSSSTLGDGAAAQPGDATWTNTFFNTGTWSSVGGDFSALTTAVQTVNGNGSYTWVSSQLVADVQAWVIAPSSDFGWILVGDEANIFTAKRFDSRQSDSVSRRPLLTVGFIPPPDLKIWKSAMPDPVIAGSNITYTVTVSNCGPRDATGVTIMDALSDDLSLVSGNANTNIGALLIGASTTVVYQAHVAASALNTITNSATVSSDTLDAIPSNDVASVTTVVNTLCDLSLRKQAAGPGIVGQAAVQVVIVTNAGPSDAQNVHVVDMLPECVLFLSATAAGACTYLQGVVNCDLGTVPAGGSASAFIRVEYLVDGTYTNIATVTTDTTETSLLNNTTQAVTRISAAALFDGPDATYGPVHLGDGRDGSLTVSNTWYVDTASSVLSSNAAVGGSKISVTDASAFKTGDELLLLAVQGSVSNAGLYDFSFVQEVSGNMLTLSSTLQNGYLPSGGSIVVQRVPHFDSVTVLSNGVLTASDWNGTNGGIVAFRVANQLDIQPGGAVSADGIGFRGGAGVQSDNDPWLRPDASGWQGESFAGLGLQDNTSANLGGGGAGLYETNNPLAFPGGDMGAGGGGGSHATEGTGGVDDFDALIDDAGGEPGMTYGTNSLEKLFFGSGGGSGGHDEDNVSPDFLAATSGSGGRGGGLVFIAVNSLILGGSISARGQDGHDAIADNNIDDAGGGGGGSGGSVLVFMVNSNAIEANAAVDGGEKGLGGRTSIIIHQDEEQAAMDA